MHNLVPDMWPPSPILQPINKVSHWKTLAIPNNLKIDYCPSTSPSCAVPHHFCKFLLLLLLLLMGSSNKHISYGCTSRFSGTHHPIPQWLWTVDCCWVSTVGLYEEGMVSPTFTCIGHQLVLDGEHSDFIGSCLTHPWERLVQHRCRHSTTISSCQIWTKTAGHFLTRYSTST